MCACDQEYMRVQAYFSQFVSVLICRRLLYNQFLPTVVNQYSFKISTSWD